MKGIAELIWILCFTTYFFGFPVDINKLLDSKAGIDCPKEQKQEIKSDDGPKATW